MQDHVCPCGDSSPASSWLNQSVLPHPEAQGSLMCSKWHPQLASAVDHPPPKPAEGMNIPVRRGQQNACIQHDSHRGYDGWECSLPVYPSSKYCHHHSFKYMSASLCHLSLMKVATYYRNVGRTIVHFWLVRTKVLSCLYLATHDQAFSRYNLLQQLCIDAHNVCTCMAANKTYIYT